MSLPSGYTMPATLPPARITEALVHRICGTEYAAKEPRFRATGKYRFDDPAQVFRTLYCARDFGTCFLETLLRARGSVGVPRADYDSRSVALLLLDPERLRLVDMFSTAGLAALDLDLSIVAGNDYGDTQQLATLAYRHVTAPDGIAYRSRFDPDAMAFVLFDRAAGAVRTYPGAAPVPLKHVDELAAGLRMTVPFRLI